MKARTVFRDALNREGMIVAPGVSAARGFPD
jgi:hypothetical protein